MKMLHEQLEENFKNRIAENMKKFRLHQDEQYRLFCLSVAWCFVVLFGAIGWGYYLL